MEGSLREVPLLRPRRARASLFICSCSAAYCRPWCARPTRRAAVSRGATVPRRLRRCAWRRTFSHRAAAAVTVILTTTAALAGRMGLRTRSLRETYCTLAQSQQPLHHHCRNSPRRCPTLSFRAPRNCQRYTFLLEAEEEMLMMTRMMGGMAKATVRARPFGVK